MRQFKAAVAAAIFSVGLFASSAQAATITYLLTLHDTVPSGISGTGTLTIAAPLLASNTYTPGPAVTLLDFDIDSQHFDVTSTFLSIHTNSFAAIDEIRVFALSPAFLSTGGLTFTYVGPGGFGSGDILLIPGGAGAEASATPLPAALPLFASGLAAMGFVRWRRKRKSAPLAA